MFLGYQRVDKGDLSIMITFDLDCKRNVKQKMCMFLGYVCFYVCFWDTRESTKEIFPS